MYYSKGVWVPPRENQEQQEQRAQNKRIDVAQRQIDKDENVNGRRGTLKGIKRNNSDAGEYNRPLSSNGNKVSDVTLHVVSRIKIVSVSKASLMGEIMQIAVFFSENNLCKNTNLLNKSM